MLRLQKQMRGDLLIQRLLRPNGVFIHAFGGGLRNGGFTQEGMNAVKDVFLFDYMGAAEYEWGEVPAALQFLLEQSVRNSVVAEKYRDVFYIAPSSYEDGVKKIIEQLMMDETPLLLRNSCGLKEALKQSHPRIVGWLEINNGFFFTVDEEMFRKTKQLLQVA